AATPAEPAPGVAGPAAPQHRNAIASYTGAYALYPALAVATGALAPDPRPDLTDTAPAAPIGPHPQWADPANIVSLDPYGHLVGEVFAEAIRAGIDARPTIAITTAHIDLPEIRQRIASGDMLPDGRVVMPGGEVRIATAEQGGVGIVVYDRKEGRALGEVTKFLVYNARKRQQGGDRADTYFHRTECVAGVQDMRVQELMPDVFHWLGIRRVDRWVSMSNMKHGALRAAGVEIVERLALPDRLVPPDAQ